MEWEGAGALCVDRPTGNPNIESGADLFAQLVRSGGPMKGLEVGRGADAAEIDTSAVSEVKSVSHVK